MKLNVGPYQGVLQLRNETPEILEFVREAVSKKKDCEILKEIQTKDGIDIYLSSQHFLRALGKKLKLRFRGDLKTNRRLFSVDWITSKKIWRSTVMFRHLSLKVGDTVKYKGEEVIVKNLGSKIQGMNKKTGKKISFSYDDFKLLDS